MGVIKRILRRTSHKILTKLGTHRSSHQLVLNAPITTSSGSLGKGGRIRRTKKINGRDAAKSEALILAAKNYLPPVQFHHVHGPNVLLGKNKFVARRTQSFCQALVFSNRVILPNERVYIKVLEIAKGWSGTIRFGFTSVDPATLCYQMPKHACPDMTNAGHTWARALADEVVRRNSVIHFSYNTNGYIHYGINNQDCGIFYANVNTRQHLWFVVDIYGLTAAVELIDPRIHNATGDLDLSRTDDEIFPDRGTMYKSTGAMDQLLNHPGLASRTKKKRSRKTSRQSAIAYDHWGPDSMLVASSLAFDQQQRSLLPNLESIVLPAQQNIYSPMPGLVNRPARSVNNLNETHDYYHILTNAHNQETRPIRGVKSTAAQNANVSLLSSGIPSALNSSSSSNSARNITLDDEEEICHQLDGVQLSDNNGLLHQQSRPKSTTTNKLPVAAGRRKLASNSVQVNSSLVSETAQENNTTSKSSHTSSSSPLSTSVNALKAKTQLASSGRTRTRNSSKIQKSSPSARDNTSPQSKDCPICFERPINCVLYQCGHMCTCYECGVKQWRTQSRTCPICRTIIKDVIKTYMS